MKIIQAPEKYEPINEISCFMAGGMGNTEWHDKFINKLKTYNMPDFVLYNPYNSNITSTYEQILWEFQYLESCDIFSIYFDKYTEQPISMYELGRRLAMTQNGEIKVSYNDKMLGSFPLNRQKCIISLHEEAPKSKEIIIQCALVHQNAINRTPEQHAAAVYLQYQKIKEEINEVR